MKSKLLYFVGGLVVGTLGGVFGSRLYFDRKYEARYEEEVASVKDAVKRRYKKKLKDLEENPVLVKKSSDNDIPVKRAKVVGRTDYTSYYTKEHDMDTSDILDPGGPEDDDPDDVRNFELREKLANNRGIEVIDEQDFGEFKHFEYRELLYFDDGIITDEEEEIVANPGALLDMTEVKEWAEKDETDVLYIRNHAVSCDFAINRQGFVYGGYDE